MHFHGTHVTPDGLGDNVLLQLRPDLTVSEADVAAYFKPIFDHGPPAKYLDLSASLARMARGPAEKYDQDNGLPPASQLWPPTKRQIDAGLWPQYQIGAYPYCYDLTKYTEDAQGRPERFRMGQCPGTQWYHAHKHGSTAINVMNGLVGAFVIEGDYDVELQKIYPDLKKTELVLVVHNIGDTPNMAKGNIHLSQFFKSPSLLVNGQPNPTIIMRPGEIQLWRLVNATIKAVTTVEGFTAISGAGAMDYRQTAQDGVQFSFENFVEQPIKNFLNQDKPRPRPSSFAPGNRMDILVKAPATPGVHQFKLMDTTDTTGRQPHDILQVSVEGNAVTMEFPTRKEDYPKLPRFLEDIKASDAVPGQGNPAKQRTLDFGWDKPNKSVAGPDADRAPQLLINGKKFDGENYDQEMVLGAVEEWTLENSTAGIAHPFHIHVNPFQVVEIFDPNATTNKTYKPRGITSGRMSSPSRRPPSTPMERSRRKAASRSATASWTSSAHTSCTVTCWRTRIAE